MAAASKFNSVVTNPGGTGSNITPTLSTHTVGDVVEIWVTKTGNAAWSAPAGWTIVRQAISPGTASTATVGTLIQHKVVSGDSLPLASPVCNLGATVTRHAICRTIRGSDLEGVYTLSEWVSAITSGTNNPIRPPTVTTPAPEMFVTHYYCQRVATNAPEPTNYTQDQQVITSGTLVTNISERTVADQQTVLANQDASPTSGGRWVGMISCVPSPDYPYYRSGSQAFNANGTAVTPALPAGTSSNDNRGNKDLVILTAQCAGVAPTVNTPAHWTLIAEWSNTTSGGVTTVRKWRAVYTGTLDRQVNRTPSGEIFAYLSVYHNAHQTIPIGTSAVQQNASSTTSTFPALPRTGTKATVQATCVADGTQTFTAPSGWTERNDSQGVTCADQSFNATGTTASASFTLNSASPTLTGLMEVFSVASVINLILTPATAMLALNTFAPDVVVGADETVTPDTASLTLATFAPTTTIGEPFPLTGILDDANRANDGDITGSLQWNGPIFVGDSPIQVVSNQLQGTNSGGNSHAWSVQLGPDCEFYAEIISTNSNDASQLLLRMTSIGGSFDGYSVRIRAGTINNLLVLRWDDGSPTIIATLPQTISAGDWFGLRLTGSLIEVFYKDVSVSSDWFLLGDVTDATYGAVGFPGLYLENASNIIDNVGGGTIGSIEVTPASAGLVLASFAPVLQLVVTPTNAALTLTTFIPTVSIRTTVTPAAALLTLTSFAPSLSLAITPVSASLTLTTFAPSITVLVTVTPDAATLSLTTFAPTVDVTAHVSVIPSPASLTLTSFAVQLREVVTVASQALSLTSFTPQLIEAVTPSSASLSLTTFAPTITTNTILTPGTASLTLTGFTPVLVERVTPATATLTLNTFAPTVTAEADVTVTPAAAQLTLTGFTPQLREQTVPSAVVLVLTTFAPEITISADIVVSPAVATLTLTTFSPSLREVVTPDVSSLVLSTFAPTITISEDRTVEPAPASLTLQSFAPQLQLLVQSTTATLNLSTFAPTITTGATGTTVIPTTRLLTLTTYAPQLLTSSPSPRRTFVVESTRRTVIIERSSRTLFVGDGNREKTMV